MSPARRKAAKRKARGRAPARRAARKSPRRAKSARRGAAKVSRRARKPGGRVTRTRRPARAKRPASAKRRAGTKRPASAKRRAGAKRPASAKRPARAKRPTSAKRTARRPRLTVVPPPKRKPAPPPQAFAEARAGASARDLVLFELVRARVAVAAAIQGMGAASAERPTASGKWSTREMVLHLAYWDREVLPLLEAAYQHGRPISLTREEILSRNPVGVEELRHHDWDAARRLLQLHRERLMEAFQSIPEEPAEMWSREHPVGKLARILTHHDRHHADVLKAARSSRGE